MILFKDLLDLVFGRGRQLVLRVDKVGYFASRVHHSDRVLPLRRLLIFRVAKVFHHHEQFVVFFARDATEV